MGDGSYNERRLIEAAKRGDQAAFRTLTEPLIRELRIHSSRILGNPHDAEDAVQETLLRAWRKLDGYAATGSLRAWLYAIATSTSLNLLKSRARGGAPSGADRPQVEPAGPGADESFEAQERVEAAFFTAVSLLPPRQRAALILRDGLGWSAVEIANLLGSTTPAVNSALQRARATLAPPGEGEQTHLGELRQALLDGYVEAWSRTDVDALVALARADASRTTLIERLRPIGGGWMTLPDSGGELAGPPSFRPAFVSNASRA